MIGTEDLSSFVLVSALDLPPRQSSVVFPVLVVQKIQFDDVEAGTLHVNLIDVAHFGCRQSAHRAIASDSSPLHEDVLMLLAQLFVRTSKSCSCIEGVVWKITRSLLPEVAVIYLDSQEETWQGIASFKICKC